MAIAFFPSLYYTVSYLCTVSAYDLFHYVSSHSISTLYYFSSPSVSMLGFIPYLCDPTLTTFPTNIIISIINEINNDPIIA